MSMFSVIMMALGLALMLGLNPPNLKDALARVTRALPASTSAVTSLAIDTGTTPAGDHTGSVEYLVTAPAVLLAALPDTKTMTYDIVHSANADLSSPATLLSSVIIQTGATANASAAAATYRFRLPSNARRYLGLKITPSASGTGDASGVSATLEATF